MLKIKQNEVMNLKVLLIINPKAGRKRLTKELNEIEANLKKNKELEIVTMYTKKEFNAEAIIKSYDLSDIGLVILCGGDGILNEGINGLMSNNNKVPMSFIPFGTMNDFAKTIKMPINKLKLSKYLSKKVNLEVENIDVGKVNERYFAYICAFGNFADIGYATSKKTKNYIGSIVYAIHILRNLTKMKSHKITIKSKGLSFTDDVIFGAVSDTIYIAGMKWYKRDELNLQDGMLDMILIRKPKNFLEYLKIIKGFIKKEYTIENNYYHRKIKDLEIICDEPIEWTVDGEFCGKMKDVKISSVKKSINIAIPKEK